MEVPKVAKPGPTDRQTNRQTERQTDRPTEFAIAICHLVNTKCHEYTRKEAKSANTLQLKT